MRIREIIIGIQAAFERYAVAATYAQANAHDIALRVIKKEKRPRKQYRQAVRQRPRMQLRTPK